MKNAKLVTPKTLLTLCVLFPREKYFTHLNSERTIKRDLRRHFLSVQAWSNFQTKGSPSFWFWLHFLLDGAHWGKSAGYRRTTKDFWTFSTEAKAEAASEASPKLSPSFLKFSFLQVLVPLWVMINGSLKPFFVPPSYGPQKLET